MRPGFFIRETLRSLKRNAIPSFAAMASVLVTMLVVGVFVPIVAATHGAANEVSSRVMLNVYLKDGVKQADIARVQAKIKDLSQAGTVKFVSKEEAYREQKRRNPEAYKLLGSNPLPDMFRITPKNPDQINELRDALAPKTANGSRSVVDPAIEQVKDRRKETGKIVTGVKVINWTLALLVLLLTAASLLLIANTIRLSLFSRRREVEVMRLVGATNWFIRWPFLLEGVAVGALGGTLAVLVLAVGKVTLVDRLVNSFAIIGTPQTISFAALAALIVFASTSIATLGSGISLRRFLRV